MSFIRFTTKRRASIAGTPSQPTHSANSLPTLRKTPATLEDWTSKAHPSTNPFRSALITEIIKDAAKEGGVLGAARQSYHMKIIGQHIVSMMNAGARYVPAARDGSRRGCVRGWGPYCRACNVTLANAAKLKAHRRTKQHAVNVGVDKSAKVDYEYLLGKLCEAKQYHGMSAEVLAKMPDLERFVEDVACAWREMNVSTAGLYEKRLDDMHFYTQCVFSRKWRDGMREIFDLRGDLGFGVEEKDGEKLIGECRRQPGDTLSPPRGYFNAEEVWEIGEQSAWYVWDLRVDGLWVQDRLPREAYTQAMTGPPNDNKCGICRLNFGEEGLEMVATKGCNHVFCGDCLDSWCNMERTEEEDTTVTCPMCRRELCEAGSWTAVFDRHENREGVSDECWPADEIAFWRQYLRERGWVFSRSSADITFDEPPSFLPPPSVDPNEYDENSGGEDPSEEFFMNFLQDEMDLSA